MNRKRIIGYAGVSYAAASEAGMPTASAETGIAVAADTESGISESADIESRVLGKRRVDSRGEDQVVKAGVDERFVEARVGKVHV